MRIKKATLLTAALVAPFFLTACDKGKKKDDTPNLPTAMTLKITPDSLPIRFESIGELKPVHSAVITPLVSGPITWVHPQLGPGMSVKKGERIFQIDPTDYQLRLRQKEASLKQAQLAYEQEKIRYQLAQDQWSREDSLQASPLAKRDLHLELAEANLAAAQAAYDEAQISLQRTSVKAPFTGVILSSGASLGMMASLSAPQTSISGQGELKVEISLSSEQVGILPPVPRPVEVYQDLPNGSRKSGEGRLIQISNVLDPRSRKLVGTVLFNPDHLDAPIAGSYVRVTFWGEPAANRAMIPSSGLLPSRELWTVSDDKLQLQAVKVLWESADSALIQLDAPIHMVLLPPEGPLPGMPVKGIPFQGSHP